MNRMRRANSFSALITLAFGALFSVAIVVAVLVWYLGLPWLGFEGARHQRLAEATQILEFTANQKLAVSRTAIDERRGNLLDPSENRSLANALALSPSDEAQSTIVRIFDRWERAYPGAFTSLRVVQTTDGKVLASSRPADVGGHFPEPDVLSRATSPGVVEWVEEVHLTEGPTIVMSRPVVPLDNDGYPMAPAAGLLVATLSMAQILEPALGGSRVGVEQPGITLVLGANGERLGALDGGPDASGVFWREHPMARGFEGSLRLLDAQGVAYLAVFRHIALSANQSWALIHYQPEDSALAPVHNQFRTAIALATLAISASLVLIWVSARRLTRPLRDLAETARALGQGQASARAAQGQGISHEFADLADAFNGMADRVEHQQQTLQAKVAERTEALSVQEERLRLAVSAGNVGIYDLNVQTGIATVNDEYAAMLGYEPSTFVETNQSWRDRLHPDDAARVTAIYIQYLAGQIPDYAVEFRQRTATGDWKWILSRGRVLSRDGQGRALRMLGTHADITLRKTVELRLQMASNVFSHAREGILIADALGQIVEVNETFTTITGYTRDEAIGRQPQELLDSGRQSTEFYAARALALQHSGYWTGEAWNRRKNGEIYAEMQTTSAVRDAEGTLQNYVTLFNDVTTLKAHQSQLEHIAHYDPLTSLPNRVLLADRLQQAMAQCHRRQQSLGVAFLDLDGFKAINDAHGHDLGDQLLIALAQRMKSALRDGDTLARLGGDEFVAVLVGLESPQDCEPVLIRLLQAAADRIDMQGQTLQVSASIGVTLYPQDAADAEQLMRHADQAMYVAKQSGKNRYHLFDVAQDAAVKTQVESVDHIRRALINHEFVLYYQPKVNMTTGAVVGAEALIRWNHPQRGLLAPGLFLPIIEDHPISVDLGEWVIRTALAQMAQWNRDGLSLSVSVNIGARQLQHTGFITSLVELLATEPTVGAQQLQLEVLETSALEDIARVSQVMLACQALGVRFALDDFGTGYSSLTYLKRLPAEQIKIDQSFVRDMLADKDDLAIVQGVIGLAHAFQREVIAEGVETIEHGTQLLSLGCSLAQGYGIARPMPAAELASWIAHWQPDPAWKRMPHKL